MKQLSKPMKKQILSAILLSLFFICASAQTDAQKKIPPFKILLSNGTYLSPDKLAKKPVVLIYFAPDCDHCRTLMQSFFKQVSNFSGTEVVMITFKPLEEVNRFVYDYGVGKYPYIKVGTEGNTFFIRYFYKLTNTPFVAVFDKTGNLFKEYRKISDAAALIQDVKKLK